MNNSLRFGNVANAQSQANACNPYQDIFTRFILKQSSPPALLFIQMPLDTRLSFRYTNTVVAKNSPLFTDNRSNVASRIVATTLEICCKKEGITEAEIDSAILRVFTGQEGLEMSQTAKIGFYQEAEARGFAMGEARGMRERTISHILTSLQKHCKVAQVPDDIVEELNRRQDIVVLDSLFEDSLDCTSLEQFRQKLA